MTAAVAFAYDVVSPSRATGRTSVPRQLLDILVTGKLGSRFQTLSSSMTTAGTLDLDAVMRVAPEFAMDVEPSLAMTFGEAARRGRALVQRSWSILGADDTVAP